MKRLLLAALLMSATPALADNHAEPVAETAATPSTPGLWKVADEDTTIYLFGTVHYLPPHMHWFGGQLPDAVAQAQEYVTEVDLSGTKQQKAALLMLREGKKKLNRGARQLTGGKVASSGLSLSKQE